MNKFSICGRANKKGLVVKLFSTALEPFNSETDAIFESGYGDEYVHFVGRYNLYADNGIQLKYRIVDGIIQERTQKELDNELELMKQKDTSSYEIQITQYKQMLSDTDYKIIKYVEGNLSKEEFDQISELRKEWRLQINNLEEQIRQIQMIYPE